MKRARDANGVVHVVAFDDDGEREYGQVLCGPWFYWQFSPFDGVERRKVGLAEPMNPTKEKKTTCLICLGSE